MAVLRKMRRLRSIGSKIRLWLSSISALPRNSTPRRREREVQPAEDLGLGLLVEVHQRVPAHQQVDPGDRRVLHQVVAAEDDRAAQVLAEAVVAVHLLEVLLGVLGRHRPHVTFDVVRVPGVGERLVVDVGGVDLDPLPEPLRAEHLGERHRETVGLLAGRAARAPHPDRVVGPAFGEHRGNDLLTEVEPCLGVAEEAGDVDQDRVEQRAELVGVDLQLVDVLAVLRHTDLAHPVPHAPHETRALVAGEVEAARLLEVAQQPLEVVVRRGLALTHREKLLARALGEHRPHDLAPVG